MKRVLDVVAALSLLVVLTPVMAIVAIGVWLNLGFPILFRQLRPGLHARPFTLVKFRTMQQPQTCEENSSFDELRLTRFGRWLRATSLDELPELWNVLRGEMSLVGPRPLLMKYLPLYSAEQTRRHDVRPGLTGWAQVKGRNALNWDEKLKLDLWYVDHQSVLLDLKILLLTVASVLRREGISSSEAATMPEFTGPAQEPSSQQPDR